MAKILVLGATGSLGRHIVQQALQANQEVSVLVRNPSKLPPEIRERVIVHQADLAKAPIPGLAEIFRNHTVVINAAGMVTEGQIFVDLVGRVITSLEDIPAKDRPISWFMAGAALLDLDDRGRRGVDIPFVSSTYWPHRVNFERIFQTSLDWRILCPGPMVDEPPLGVARLRISIDRLPVQGPSTVKSLPGLLVLPFFVDRVPEMIVSYADAAAVLLANLTPGGAMTRHRVGLALPVGMRGRKGHWAAKPNQQ